MVRRSIPGVLAFAFPLLFHVPLVGSAQAAGGDLIAGWGQPTSAAPGAHWVPAQLLVLMRYQYSSWSLLSPSAALGVPAAWEPQPMGSAAMSQQAAFLLKVIFKSSLNQKLSDPPSPAEGCGVHHAKHACVSLSEDWGSREMQLCPATAPRRGMSSVHDLTSFSQNHHNFQELHHRAGEGPSQPHRSGGCSMQISGAHLHVQRLKKI